MEETVLMVFIIGGLILGWLLPTKKVKRLDLPFEIVIRGKEKKDVLPKIVIKEVIRYVDRPKSVVRQPVRTPRASPTVVAAQKRMESPQIKSMKPQRNVEALREAKAGLMALGYGAGEAKRILESIGRCSTAEEYIKKAMMRTKK
jgi:hypothetical protein